MIKLCKCGEVLTTIGPDDQRCFICLYANAPRKSRSFETFQSFRDQEVKARTLLDIPQPDDLP